MGDGRLSHLMLMSVEKELVKTFNLEELVTTFAQVSAVTLPLPSHGRVYREYKKVRRVFPCILSL